MSEKDVLNQDIEGYQRRIKDYEHEIREFQQGIEDNQRAIDTAKGKLEDLEVTYSIGDRFEQESEFEEEDGKYILAKSGQPEVTLICLHNGNRWNGGRQVKDLYKITQKEMNKITGSGKFTRYQDSPKDDD